MTDPIKPSGTAHVLPADGRLTVPKDSDRIASPTTQPSASPTAADGVDRIRPSVPLEGERPEMVGIKHSDPRVQARRDAQPKKWILDGTGNAIVRHLQQQLGFDAATARRIVETPLGRLPRADIVRLTNKRLSPESVQHLQGALQQVSQALAQRGDTRLAQSTLEIAKRLPGRVDAFGAKSLYDLIQRLPKMHQRELGNVDIRVPAIGDVGEDEGTRRRTFTFGHDLESAAITDGYFVYFGVAPPESSNQWESILPLDIGLVVPNSAGTYTYHFEDTNSVLDSETKYYVWMTAYNESGESEHSNILHERFPVQLDGDLNVDGVIDYADVEILARMLANDPETAPDAADVDGSGSVTMDDYYKLVDMATGNAG